MCMNEPAISEELALEYYMSGDLVEAVKIYQKLIILYPEKTNYWQAQINLLASPISDEEINSYRDDLKKWNEEEGEV
jgi:hypothetical protein